MGLFRRKKPVELPAPGPLPKEVERVRRSLELAKLQYRQATRKLEEDPWEEALGAGPDPWAEPGEEPR